jgi:hypothetical protein
VTSGSSPHRHPVASAAPDRKDHAIRVIPLPDRTPQNRGRHLPTELESHVGWLFGVIYLVLLITLGVITLRKRHWVMFVLGFFLPIFWLIGALMRPRFV